LITLNFPHSMIHFACGFTTSFLAISVIMLFRVMGSRSAFDEKSPLAAVWRAKESKMKYREIIADNLSKAGWSWGGVSAIHSNG
jgi:hypothetical protein